MTISSALQALAVLALLAAATPAWAADPAAGIRAQVRGAHSIHQRDGMAGLEVASRACWSGEGGFSCLHLDVAAGTLDRNFAEALGIANHPYFGVETALRRAHPVFNAARWDMETSNAYLQSLMPWSADRWGTLRGVSDQYGSPKRCKRQGTIPEWSILSFTGNINKGER